jgi:hypothetical protein
MTTVLLTRQQTQTRRLPEFAFVFGVSIVGLIFSLALALATWPDGPIVAP